MGTCSKCGVQFDLNLSGDHFHIESPENAQIKLDYPIQDDIWPSRRWNAEQTNYQDMSGGGDSYICQGCYELTNSDLSPQIPVGLVRS